MKLVTLAPMLLLVAVACGSSGSPGAADDPATVTTRPAGQDGDSGSGEPTEQTDGVPGEEPDGEPTGLAADDAYLEVVGEQYAKTFDVSIEEAKRRLIRQDELSPLMQEIGAVEEGRIAGRGIVHEPVFGGWVYLVGDEPPTATTAAIQRANDDIYVHLRAEYTLTELQDAMDQMSTWEPVPESMRERIAYTDIDVRANSFVVAIDRNTPPVDPGDGIESLPLEEAAAALEELLEAATELPLSVVLGSRATTD